MIEVKPTEERTLYKKARTVASATWTAAAGAQTEGAQ